MNVRFSQTVVRFVPLPGMVMISPLSPSSSRQCSTRGSSFTLPSRSFARTRCCRQDLKGQTVAVIGLGVSGRAAARLALTRGASVLAIDSNELWTPPEGDPIIDVIGGMRTLLGPCVRSDLLENVDRFVVSPGVSPEKYGLLDLMRSGWQVMSEIDFAAEILPHDLKVLAVTGTNGKSTVTSLAAQILHQLGIDAYIGGNFGIPLSEISLKLLESSTRGERYEALVVEVSSAQMEIPPDYFHSSVALVMNLTPDHLERHVTMQNYADAKCHIFSHMKHHKIALIPTGSRYLNEAFSCYARNCNVSWIGHLPGIVVDMDKKVAKISDPIHRSVGDLNLRSFKSHSYHNYCNAAMAAFAVLGLDFGIDLSSISAIMDKLNLLPHRIQFVCKDACGLTWIDDSKSTNIGATYMALETLKAHKLVILLGGVSKVFSTDGTSGFIELVEILNNHRGVVTFGYSSEVIRKDLLDGSLSIPCVRTVTLADAVTEARKIAQKGDTILLSPGCSSFDEFENFEHRGNTFQQLAHSAS